MGTREFTYCQDGYVPIGWLDELPDHRIQGESLDELREHRLDLHKDLTSEFVNQSMRRESVIRPEENDLLRRSRINDRQSGRDKVTLEIIEIDS